MVEVEREKLLDVLITVKPALAVQQFVPVLGCFCFTGGNVYAYNDTIGITAPSPINMSLGISSHILDVLKTMTGKIVKLSEEDSVVKVVCSRTSLKLPSVSDDQFIFAPPTPKKPKPSFQIPFSKEVKQGIDLCLQGFAENPTVPLQRGLVLELVSGKMYLYSTNNVTVSRYFVGKAPESAPDLITVLPQAFCIAMLELAKDDSSPPIINFDSKADSVWAFFSSGVSLFAKQPSPFDISPLKALFKKFPSTAEPILEDLVSAAGRASLLSRLGGGADRTELKKSKKGNLSIVTSTSSAGAATDIVKGTGPDNVLVVSPESFNKAVGLCDAMSFTSSTVCFTKGTKFKHILSVLEWRDV